MIRRRFKMEFKSDLFHPFNLNGSSNGGSSGGGNYYFAFQREEEEKKDKDEETLSFSVVDRFEK